jgi:2-(1,2-epoxy-1,2-dihydrophenyl)acetyl-CoA isomerase
MQYKTLLFDIHEGVASITFNRPEVANTINLEMASDLMYAAMRCSEDPEVRAVLISGAGKNFCSGGDLKSFFSQDEKLPHHLREVTIYLHAAISHLTHMSPPVIAAVNGSAAGAGLSLTCACDIVVAAESALFIMGYTSVGLTPDGSSTYFLPRIVGIRRALEMTLTNRVLSAHEALDWGIVTQVVPDKELIIQANNLTSKFANGPAKALGVSKRLLYSGLTATLETQMEYESQSIASTSRTFDTREGITAFLEKRTPIFKGQ